MKNATPIVIEGINHQGTFGERLGRIYTLEMPDGKIRQAYLFWDTGNIDYFFSRMIEEGFENTPDPESHLSREARGDLSKLLEAFDAETCFGRNIPERLLAKANRVHATQIAALG